MTDYQIYNYIYLFVVSFFTICAVQRYKTQLVNNLRQDNINNPKIRNYHPIHD